MRRRSATAPRATVSSESESNAELIPALRAAHDAGRSAEVRIASRTVEVLEVLIALFIEDVERLERHADAVTAHHREILFRAQIDGDRKSTRLNSSHSQISYAV